MRKLSPAQLEALGHVYHGRPVTYGIKGGSAYGGLAGTIRVLIDQELLTKTHDITPEGRRRYEKETGCNPAPEGN